VILTMALLAMILTLLSERIQERLRHWFRRSTGALAAAAALAALFCSAAAWYGALGWQLAVIILAYTFVPVLLVDRAARGSGAATLFDLGAILALWLPLELSAGATLVPRPVQGILHAIAYGIAVLLVLVVFLLYRRFSGMKYNVPRSWSDFGLAGTGFVCAAAVLIPVGLATGFLNPIHAPTVAAGTAFVRAAMIFAGTALPEEILFRALIQNWIVQRFGSSNLTIALAALIFGLAHLNNGPGPLPNWRYALVATLAGAIFGKVFQKSTSILASALVHTAVNTVKFLLF
jgi:membrane protease YdiL (CAAX protease family)